MLEFELHLMDYKLKLGIELLNILIEILLIISKK